MAVLDPQVAVEALATMPMPSYGVGTAWDTEVCPFCAWEGEADSYTPPEKQAHAEKCPVRLARLETDQPAAVGRFYSEHKVDIEPGSQLGYEQGRCRTCGWRGAPHPKDGTRRPWVLARDEVFAHRAESKAEADGMGPNDKMAGQ